MLWCALAGELLHGANAALQDRLRAALRNGQPNIVFILADDLGYGDLGCYGQSRIKTPNIDALAKAGTRFTQFYAGSTVCAPSRAVLMTGLHTGHSRIRNNDQNPLLPEDITLAKILSKARYQTAMLGKWGLGLPGSTGEPGKQGFDEWRGYLDQVHAHDYYPSKLYRNGEEWPMDQNANGQRGLYVPDLMIQMTTNYIRTAQFRPFFLFLPTTLPHANNERGAATGNGMEIPSDAPYSSEPWPAPEKNKAAMISRLDADVGRILTALRNYKLETNTIVIFTSDNGPHSEGGVKADFHKSSGGLRGIKRDLYEGGIRVPFIVRWPGKVPAGRVSSEVGTFWDIMPTLLECAGLPQPRGIDGISLYREWVGLAQTNRHDHLYWEFHENGSKQAARKGEWKAVRNEPGKPLELYNLNSDPSETKDVSGEQPEIVKSMEKILKEERRDEARWPLLPRKTER